MREDVRKLVGWMATAAFALGLSIGAGAVLSPPASSQELEPKSCGQLWGGDWVCVDWLYDQCQRDEDCPV
jgi:hypothetical protein